MITWHQDGSLNIVNKRKLSKLLLWEYRKLMRISGFTLLIFFLIVYGLIILLGSGLILGSNDFHLPVNRSYSAEDLKRYKMEQDCWENVGDFYESFILSMEIVTTIGYGKRLPNPECPIAVNITMAINLLGIFFYCSFSGVFLAWFINSRPGQIKFSSVAVITQRKSDKALFFMIRVADPLTIGVDILGLSGICISISKQRTDDKHSPINHWGDMSFSAFSNNVYRRVHLMWPTVVAHKIDHTSPLFTLSPEALKNSNIEVIITVTGIRTETGSRILCKTSYLSEEIIWGARFRPVAGLSRSDSLNIGSYGQEDLDTVSLESRTPRQSAESLELESRERCALRIEAWWR